eukprot:CAMPEP_0117859780 /NCGR_PEP_ID=MMETSP0950-20121206/3364_1 /TAXON_ID=44440 /ORGANISM="Chattonella subsalsa, Strain CCMP2191" /LENGTH=154 /DNA_ID=CAMNT_0005709773 /DNA_START=115 /DNA_END=579 /DNA_ORIENTATION=-
MDQCDDVFQATPTSGISQKKPMMISDSLLSLVDDIVSNKAISTNKGEMKENVPHYHTDNGIQHSEKASLSREHERYLSKVAKQIKAEEKQKKKAEKLDVFQTCNKKKPKKIRAKAQKGNTYSIVGCVTPRGTISINEKVNDEGDEYMPSDDDEC